MCTCLKNDAEVMCRVGLHRFRLVNVAFVVNSILISSFEETKDALRQKERYAKSRKNFLQQLCVTNFDWMIKEMIKRYSVLMCLITSVIFIVIATLTYPGGSLFDKNSVGFGWSKNFLSNLFETYAINGSENQGRIWALIGMAFHAVGYGVFFINISTKISSGQWNNILKFIGFANIILVFLIATPLHDVGVISIVLTLLGLFTITVSVLKSKLLLLKFCCIFCLLTFYCFFALYGFGYLSLAVIMQKVYIICSMLLALALEYCTRYEDFIQTTCENKKYNNKPLT